MRVLQQVVGFAGFDFGDEGAQSVEGAGEVVVLLACDGCVGVAVGVGTEPEAGAALAAERGLPGDVRHLGSPLCDHAMPSRF